jgi:hypothetical protein
MRKEVFLYFYLKVTWEGIWIMTETTTLKVIFQARHDESLNTVPQAGRRSPQLERRT